MGVSSVPKTVTRQRRDCDLKSGPSAPESSALTTRLPSHPIIGNLNAVASSRGGANEGNCPPPQSAPDPVVGFVTPLSYMPSVAKETMTSARRL